MPATIDYQFVANVSDGPTLVVSQSVEVDAYERIEITIPPDDSEITVTLSVAADAQMLAVKSTQYDNLTYQSVANSTIDMTLDAPHLFLGTGMIARLDITAGNPLTQLKFKKNGGEEAIVTILVGRDATP